MEQGQGVLYYTHTGNDGVSDTQDQVAIVLRDNGNCVDLVVFPVGGPVKFVTACEFDPEDPYLVDGGSYIREAGSEPPDFSTRFRYSGDPAYAAELNRIRKEREEAPGNRREELKKQHQQQMAEVVKKLDEKNRPEGEAPRTVELGPEPQPNPNPGGPPNQPDERPNSPSRPVPRREV